MPDSAAEDKTGASKNVSGNPFEAGALTWARIESTPFWPSVVLKAENDLFQVQVRFACFVVPPLLQVL